MRVASENRNSRQLGNIILAAPYSFIPPDDDELVALVKALYVETASHLIPQSVEDIIEQIRHIGESHNPLVHVRNISESSFISIIQGSEDIEVLPGYSQKLAGLVSHHQVSYRVMSADHYFNGKRAELAQFIISGIQAG